jgi:hypothetical protein
MPRIVPDTCAVPEHRAVFSELERQLPADFVVFHRRPWHAPTASGSAKDSEADFVIAHEKKGILVLQLDGDGQTAARLAKSLAKRLGELPAGAARTWSVAHAVAFREPDLFAPVVLEKDDVKRLAAWIDGVLRGQPAPGADGLQLLSSLLAVGFEVQTLAKHEAELARLTVEQFRVLDGLARFRRLLVCGCAGSGKTMLAVEKVKRLADQGLVPLFVCFNARLRDSVRELLKGWRNAAVDNFHGLCERWIQRAKLKVERKPGDEYWDRQLPDALLAATRKIPERFDAIVVDEGQDFLPNWWRPLEATLKDERRGALSVFYDDNQTLYNRELKFPPVDSQFDLTENVRNVRRVHDLVAKFYKMNRKLTSRASPGPEPRVVIYRTIPEMLAAVEKTIERWAEDEKIGPQHIAILTGHGKEKSAVWRARRLAGWELTDEMTAKPGQIVWSSVHGFKGLERAAVILAEIEPISHAELDTILYVGCSRARVHLTVVASEAAAALAALNARFPKST